jgi:hypothetical protein
VADSQFAYANGFFRSESFVVDALVSIGLMRPIVLLPPIVLDFLSEFVVQVVNHVANAIGDAAVGLLGKLSLATDFRNHSSCSSRSPFFNGLQGTVDILWGNVSLCRRVDFRQFGTSLRSTSAADTLPSAPVKPDLTAYSDANARSQIFTLAEVPQLSEKMEFLEIVSGSEST